MNSTSGFSEDREFFIPFSPSNIPTEDLNVSINSLSRSEVYLRNTHKYNYSNRDIRAGVYVSDPNLVEVVNIEPYKTSNQKFNFSLRLKNLNTIQPNEKKMIMFFATVYDFEKNPNGDDISGKSNVAFASGYIFLYNRGSNAPNLELEKRYEMNLQYYGEGKEKRNSFKKKFKNQGKSQNFFLSDWNNSLANNSLTRVPVIVDDLLMYFIRYSSPDKYYIRASSKIPVDHLEPVGFWKKITDVAFEGEVTKNGNYIAAFPNSNYRFSFLVDVVGTRKGTDGLKAGNVLKGAYVRPKGEVLPKATPPIPPKNIIPAFVFKVEKRGSKYFLLARAKKDIEFVEPIEFWKRVDARTYEAEITKNGTFGATFPNHTEMSTYQIDFFGTGKEPVQGWNTGKSSVKAGEPAPIDPESPILPQPSRPATPTNPSTPAPIDPTSPILPKPTHPTTSIDEVTPKETPETTLVIDDTKKKPYDPTFLIVSGIFATAIIFGE